MFASASKAPAPAPASRDDQTPSEAPAVRPAACPGKEAPRPPASAAGAGAVGVVSACPPPPGPFPSVLGVGGPALCLAAAIYLALHPVVLVLPVALLANHQVVASTGKPLGGWLALRAVVVFTLLTGAGLALLLGASWWYSGSWEFLRESYGWVLGCGDLSPNVGLFWYFFAETFERFRPYFLLVLLAHPLIYSAPLSARLARFPLVAASVLACVAALFQCYPSGGDGAAAGCLLVIHPKVLCRVPSRPLLLALAVTPLLLMPLMWYLWLTTGSGNVNFFYFQNLAYCFLMCLLILQFCAAAVERRKALMLAYNEFAVLYQKNGPAKQ